MRLLIAAGETVSAAHEVLEHPLLHHELPVTVFAVDGHEL
jgi:hypothetical protein